MGKYIYFNGLKFTRDDATGYYLNGTIRKRLHRYVWEYHNGEIKRGYHIHHIDGDKSNNDISNLEEMKQSDHLRYHGLKNAENNYDAMIKNLDENARPKANEWHRSKEGREWHKKQDTSHMHAKREYECKNCGEKFMSVRNGYCSNKCKSAYRRKLGLDNITKICEVCGKEFKANKYGKQKCCSRECASVYRSKVYKSK